MAEKKRRAYQCLRCLHRNNTTYVEAKYRVEAHILKLHLGLDEVPFYCKLCLFRCFKREDLEQHVTTFPRHRLMLQEKGLADSRDMLVQNPNAHQIDERDMVALSPEQSHQHWMAKRKKPDILALALSQACPDGIMTESPTTSPQTTAAGNLGLGSPLIQQLQLFQKFQEFQQLLGASTTTQLQTVAVPPTTRPVKTSTVTSGALLEEEQTARPTAQLTEATTMEQTTTSPTLPTTATRPNNDQVSPSHSTTTFGTDTGVLVHDELDYEDDVEEDVMADVLPGKTPSSVEVAETRTTGQDEERGCQADKDGDVRQLLVELKRSTERNTMAIQQQEEKVVQLASTMMELIRVLKEKKPKADKRTQTEEPPRKTQTEEPPRKTQTEEPSRKRQADSDRRYNTDRQHDSRRYNNYQEEKRRREDRHDNRWRR